MDKVKNKKNKSNKKLNDFISEISKECSLVLKKANLKDSCINTKSNYKNIFSNEHWTKKIIDARNENLQLFLNKKTKNNSNSNQNNLIKLVDKFFSIKDFDSFEKYVFYFLIISTARRININFFTQNYSVDDFYNETTAYLYHIKSIIPKWELVLELNYVMGQKYDDEKENYRIIKECMEYFKKDNPNYGIDNPCEFTSIFLELYYNLWSINRTYFEENELYIYLDSQKNEHQIVLPIISEKLTKTRGGKIGIYFFIRAKIFLIAWWYLKQDKISKKNDVDYKDISSINSSIELAKKYENPNSDDYQIRILQYDSLYTQVGFIYNLLIINEQNNIHLKKVIDSEKKQINDENDKKIEKRNRQIFEIGGIALTLVTFAIGSIQFTANTSGDNLLNTTVPIIVIFGCFAIFWLIYFICRWSISRNKKRKEAKASEKESNNKDENI